MNPAESNRMVHGVPSREAQIRSFARSRFTPHLGRFDYLVRAKAVSDIRRRVGILQRQPRRPGRPPVLLGQVEEGVSRLEIPVARSFWSAESETALSTPAVISSGCGVLIDRAIPDEEKATKNAATTRASVSYHPMSFQSPSWKAR